MTGVSRALTVCVVGDDQVGKSSLIAALVSSSFHSVPSLLQPILVPLPQIFHSFCPSASSPSAAAASAGSSGFSSLRILDTSSASHKWPDTVKSIRQADALLLVCSALPSQSHSLDRLFTFWLPRCRDLNVRVPIIVAVNKSALSFPSSYSPLSSPSPLHADRQRLEELSTHVQVERVIHCSAQHVFHVSEVFYAACQAVTAPLAPLIERTDGHRSSSSSSAASVVSSRSPSSASERETSTSAASSSLRATNVSYSLREEAVRALKRLFRLFDQDEDQVLNQTELDHYQRICYHRELSETSMQTLRLLLSKQEPFAAASVSHSHPLSTSSSSSFRTDSSYLDTQGSITFAGFCALHVLMLVKSRRADALWSVLQCMGYSKPTLQLKLEIPDIAKDGHAELSVFAVYFLRHVFHKFADPVTHRLCIYDATGMPSTDAMLMFEAAPDKFMPFKPSHLHSILHFKREAKFQDVDVQGWISLWALLAYSDPNGTMAALAYLGYPSPPLPRSPSFATLTEAIRVHESRALNRKMRKHERFSTVHSLVLGSSTDTQSFLAAAQCLFHVPSSSCASLVVSMSSNPQSSSLFPVSIAHRSSVTQPAACAHLSDFNSEQSTNASSVQLADCLLFTAVSPDQVQVVLREELKCQTADVLVVIMDSHDASSLQTTRHAVSLLPSFMPCVLLLRRHKQASTNELRVDELYPLLGSRCPLVVVDNDWKIIKSEHCHTTSNNTTPSTLWQVLHDAANLSTQHHPVALATLQWRWRLWTWTAVLLSLSCLGFMGIQYYRRHTTLPSWIIYRERKKP